jgi:hypothetical protein
MDGDVKFENKESGIVIIFLQNKLRPLALHLVCGLL